MSRSTPSIWSQISEPSKKQVSCKMLFGTDLNWMADIFFAKKLCYTPIIRMSSIMRWLFLKYWARLVEIVLATALKYHRRHFSCMQLALPEMLISRNQSLLCTFRFLTESFPVDISSEFQFILKIVTHFQRFLQSCNIISTVFSFQLEIWYTAGILVTCRLHLLKPTILNGRTQSEN